MGASRLGVHAVHLPLGNKLKLHSMAYVCGEWIEFYAFVITWRRWIVWISIAE